MTTVLVLDRDAAEYLESLSDLGKAGLRLLGATDPGDLPEGSEQAVVALGEPDRLAAALPFLPSLEWVQSSWAGVTPLLPAARAGLSVTGIKDVFGGQMAEYVLGGLLEHVLALPARRAAQRRGEWLTTPTGTLAGKTIGIMGTGSIGSEIALRAGAFGLRTLGLSRGGAQRPNFETVYPVADLREFLSRCDFLVGVLPDTPDTRGLLDASAFAALPAGAYVVNVGRGTLIDDAALVEALRSGHLSGALLDVFNDEPLPDGHPFWTTTGLTITAHVAARSWPSDISAIFRDNVARWLAGESLRYQLDPDLGY